MTRTAGERRKTWTRRWDEQLILMTWEETKKKPEWTEKQERWEQQHRHTKARTEPLCSLVLCCWLFMHMWCSLTLSTCTSRTPRLWPAPPVYGLKHCLAHIQYIDSKGSRWLTAALVFDASINAQKLWQGLTWKAYNTHIHTEPYWSGLLMDGSIIAPASVRRLDISLSRALSLLLCRVNGLEAPRSRWGCLCQTAYSLCADSLLYSGAWCVRQSQRRLFGVSAF